MVTFQEMSFMYGEMTNSIQQNDMNESKVFVEVTPQNSTSFDASDPTDRKA
jgi:hypothetical protein